MLGWIADIEQATLRNETFRTVLFTGEHTELTVMRMAPGEDIGLEAHHDRDQFLRIEQGTGEHDDADRGRCRQLSECLAQRNHVLQVEGVEPFGAIEGDGRHRAVVLDPDAQLATFAASTSAKICSGPSGVRVAFTPSGRNASATALATAACAPMAPPSPMPL